MLVQYGILIKPEVPNFRKCSKDSAGFAKHDCPDTDSDTRMFEDLGWKNLAERKRDLSLAFFLPARRYASADTSYGSVSVSVCLHLSVASWSSIEPDERIELVFGMGAFFDLSCVYFKKIRVSSK